VSERKLPDGTVLRELRGQAELDEAVRLQEETWGAGFTERVPAAMLLVGQKIGGVSAGAFTPAGALIGFVFGLTGVKNGRLVHWSDMLAVRAEGRGRHLGEALKHYQRERCRAIGVETMYWTYDPFVARNAYLNLNRLGATIDQFVPDMYGTNTNSPMHGSLGTDRFVAAWAVSTEPVPMSGDPALLAGVPVAGGPPGIAPDSTHPLPDADVVAVAVPNDYHALLGRDLELARAWRASARRAFVNYLGNGWHVSAFIPSVDGDATYLLSRHS
jgi:predicted GNAT superfamily acetyltransferase